MAPVRYSSTGASCPPLCSTGFTCGESEVKLMFVCRTLVGLNWLEMIIVLQGFGPTSLNYWGSMDRVTWFCAFSSGAVLKRTNIYASGGTDKFTYAQPQCVHITFQSSFTNLQFTFLLQTNVMVCDGETGRGEERSEGNGEKGRAWIYRGSMFWAAASQSSTQYRAEYDKRHS